MLRYVSSTVLKYHNVLKFLRNQIDKHKIIVNYLQTTGAQFSLHDTMADKKEKQASGIVEKFCVDISRARERVVCKACEEYGFELVDSMTDDCFLTWTNMTIDPKEFSQLKHYQKVNCFLNLDTISHKNLLAMNMKRVHRYLPNDFNITPKSWVLPEEYVCFKKESQSLSNTCSNQTYIVKPRQSSRGEGIWLLKDVDKIKDYDQLVAQEYLDQPLLMDGYKFDLRLYVLMTSCDPLKLYLYKDGMVRMASDPYIEPSEENMNNFYMHLTNTAINGSNHKKKTYKQSNIRTLKWFWKWLELQTENYEKVIKDIEDVVIKTFLLANPHVKHAYHKYRNGIAVGGSHSFHLLGVDVLLDTNYKPWLLEVNLRPSLFSTLVDMKQALVTDVLKVINLRPSDRFTVPGDEKPCQQDYSENMKQIFPVSSSELQSYYRNLQQVCELASQDHLIEPANYVDHGKRKESGGNSTKRVETYEEKTMCALHQFKQFQICIINDKDYVQVDQILNKVESNWPEHSRRISDYWLNTFDNQDREEVVESIREVTNHSLLRTWKTWDVNSLDGVPLFEILNKLLTAFCMEEGKLFGTACSQANFTQFDLFQLSKPNHLSEVEKECCKRIFTLCKEYVIVHSHWSKITEACDGFSFGIQCTSRKMSNK